MTSHSRPDDVCRRGTPEDTTNGLPVRDQLPNRGDHRKPLEQGSHSNELVPSGSLIVLRDQNMDCTTKLDCCTDGTRISKRAAVPTMNIPPPESGPSVSRTSKDTSPNDIENRSIPTGKRASLPIRSPIHLRPATSLEADNDQNGQPDREDRECEIILTTTHVPRKYDHLPDVGAGFRAEITFSDCGGRNIRVEITDDEITPLMAKHFGSEQGALYQQELYPAWQTLRCLHRCIMDREMAHVRGIMTPIADALTDITRAQMRFNVWCLIGA